MSGKRWWEFGLFDVVWCVGCLTVLYWIFGPPTTLFGWLAVAPSLLLGSWISHRFRARGNRG